MKLSENKHTCCGEHWNILCSLEYQNQILWRVLTTKTERKGQIENFVLKNINSEKGESHNPTCRYQVGKVRIQLINTF